MADEKPKIPTKSYHLWQIGLIVLLFGFMIYASFFKHTSSTVVRDGGKIINVSSENADHIPIARFGCMRVNLDLYWQKAPKLPDAPKK